MKFVAVAIVSAIVLGHPFNKSRLLIGLNCILLCLINSSQITKYNNVLSLYAEILLSGSFIKVERIFCSISAQNTKICFKLSFNFYYLNNEGTTIANRIGSFMNKTSIDNQASISIVDLVFVFLSSLHNLDLQINTD